MYIYMLTCMGISVGVSL